MENEIDTLNALDSIHLDAIRYNRDLAKKLSVLFEMDLDDEDKNALEVLAFTIERMAVRIRERIK